MKESRLINVRRKIKNLTVKHGALTFDIVDANKSSIFLTKKKVKCSYCEKENYVKNVLVLGIDINERFFFCSSKCASSFVKEVTERWNEH